MVRPDADDDLSDTLPRFDPQVGDVHEPADSPVTRIVRVSRAQVQGSAMDGLFAARKRVLGEGRVPGLSGAVLHVAGWFVLWQEGPPAAVQVALEPQPQPRRARYGTPRLIHRSVGARTLHEPLALSITQWPEPPELFSERLEAVAAAGPRLPPDEIWRALSEPCGLAGGSPVRPPARVALLASEGQRSVEIARRLAEQFGCTLVYRRFASAQPGSIDVGTAYFDLSVAGRTLRVQAVSRRAFGHALLQQSLRHAERVVVEAVGDPSAKAMGLAAEVAGFVRGADPSPAIEVIGDAGDAGDAAGAVAAFLREHTGARVLRHARPGGDTELMALLHGVSPS